MPLGPFLRRTVLACAALLAGVLSLPADDAPEESAPPLALVFVTSNTVLAENFPRPTTLSEWLKSAVTATQAVLATQPVPPAVLVQITLAPAAPPRFEFAGRPALDDSVLRALQTRLATLPDLRAPLCEVCVRIQTPGETASPLAEAATFVPRLFPPDEAALNRFIAADLATQYRELRAWSRERALPLLAHHAAQADPQYTGVVALGQALSALPADAALDVAALSYRRSDYWRAVMEMAPGDLLVASLPVFLHAAAGEIDQASTLLGLLHSFGRDNTLARQLLNEFAARLGPFRRQLTEHVQRGVAFHDAGKFTEAIAAQERVLAAYPHSAWARYELFFSTVTRDGFDTKKKLKRANRLWYDDAAPAIFRANPLYAFQFGSTRGKDFAAMLDRLILHRLANKPPEDPAERIGCFADAALRLGDYGTAALVYWSALGTTQALKGLSFANDQPIPLTKEDVLARYLYCLEKLGVPDWKGEFEGDFAAAFRQLDATLAAHRAR